jgi:protein TonB
MEAVKPEYPDTARRAGVEGLVAVCVVIDETGTVIAAEIAASDAPILNEASLQAANRHRFKPAYQHDAPVKAKIGLRFRFLLDE